MRILLTDYYLTLVHWSRKLNRSPNRARFLFTKLFEITSTILHRGVIKSKSIEEDVVPQFLLKENGLTSEQPLMAIVVPVFVRNLSQQEKLYTLINSIQSQAYPHLKVILVDDCSPLFYTIPDNFHAIKLSQNKGPAHARNAGIEHALEMQAEIIAFTDSDCVLDKKWAVNIISTFINKKDAHALSGNTISYNKGWFGDYQNINGTLNGRMFRYSEHLLYGATCNFALTRNVLAEGVRFDTTFPSAAAEDLEFSFKIIRNGYNIYFADSMIVYHDYGYNGKLQHDFKIFWKQFARYGEGERRLLEMIPYYYDYLDRSDEIESTVEDQSLLADV